MKTPASKPSEALLDAAMLWVRGWTREGRGVVEDALVAVAREAEHYMAPRYGTLYRAHEVTDEEMT